MGTGGISTSPAPSRLRRVEVVPPVRPDVAGALGSLVGACVSAWVCDEPGGGAMPHSLQ